MSKEGGGEAMNAKFEEAFAKKQLSKRKDRQVILLLDETKVKKKRNGRMAYVLICLDITRREVISAKSYRSVSIPSTVDTVNHALDLCRGGGSRSSSWTTLRGTHLRSNGFRSSGYR
jgi:hypothetical protein